MFSYELRFGKDERGRFVAMEWIFGDESEIMIYTTLEDWLDTDQYMRQRYVFKEDRILTDEDELRIREFLKGE